MTANHQTWEIGDLLVFVINTKSGNDKKNARFLTEGCIWSILRIAPLTNYLYTLFAQRLNVAPTSLLSLLWSAGSLSSMTDEDESNDSKAYKILGIFSIAAFIEEDSAKHIGV